METDTVASSDESAAALAGGIRLGLLAVSRGECQRQQYAAVSTLSIRVPARLISRGHGLGRAADPPAAPGLAEHPHPACLIRYRGVSTSGR